MKRRKNKYLNGDRSLKIVSRDSNSDPRLIGSITPSLAENWNTASEKTLTELAMKGVLSEYHLSKLHEAGIDIEKLQLEDALADLNIENDEDFIKFIEIVQSNPNARKVYSKLQSKKQAQETRKVNKERKEKLTAELKKLDLDDPKDLARIVELQKEFPETLDLMAELQ